MRATNVDAKVSGFQGGIQSGNPNGLQVKPGTGLVAGFLRDGLEGGKRAVCGVGALALSIVAGVVFMEASCWMIRFASSHFPHFNNMITPYSIVTAHGCLRTDIKFSLLEDGFLISTDLYSAGVTLFVIADLLLGDRATGAIRRGVGNIWANIQARFPVLNMNLKG